jgi:RNA polymerase sigma-70 factor (ECF subfamily)
MRFEQVLARPPARWVTVETDWERVCAAEMPRVFNFFRYRLGHTADAADLTARTFEQAWRSRYPYQSDGAGFATWLLTIARNVAIDHLRARQRCAPMDRADRPPSSDPTPEAQAVAQSHADRFVALLGTLPPRQRELMAMKYGAWMTNRAIARATGLSESHVGTILDRAVESLRRRW